MDRPTVSVVVPTFNRLSGLQRALRALAQQSVPRSSFEVIVVSDGSTDGTNEYLTSQGAPLPVVAVIAENGGPATARNRGVEVATGEVVLFVDDDVVAERDLVAAHMAAHTEHGPDVVVIGPMLTPADFDLSPWVSWEQTMLYKQYDAMTAGKWTPTARQFYTGNASLRRTHIVACGGFDPAFRRAEDVEFAHRLADFGLRFVFESRARGYHYAERSFTSWIGIASAYGRNNAVFVRDFGRTWLFDAMCEEFHRHHPLVRVTTAACLGRPRLKRITSAALAAAARATNGIGLRAVGRYALSGLYNLEYYQGFADELPGAARTLTRRDAAPGPKGAEAR